MIEAKCWNCGKINKEQPCGYYMCDCKSYEQSKFLWYLPTEIFILRKELIRAENEKKERGVLFLDDEERNG